MRTFKVFFVFLILFFFMSMSAFAVTYRSLTHNTFRYVCLGDFSLGRIYVDTIGAEPLVDEDNVYSIKVDTYIVDKAAKKIIKGKAAFKYNYEETYGYRTQYMSQVIDRARSISEYVRREI